MPALSLAPSTGGAAFPSTLPACRSAGFAVAHLHLDAAGHHAGGEAAIGIEDVAVDVGGRVGIEEDQRIGLLGRGRAAIDRLGVDVHHLGAADILLEVV